MQNALFYYTREFNFNAKVDRRIKDVKNSSFSSYLPFQCTPSVCNLNRDHYFV